MLCLRRRKLFVRAIFFCTIILTSLPDDQCAAQDVKPLLSGTLFKEALRHRQSLNASGASLRRTVTNLQSRTGLAILLDRRTDPSTVVNIETEYVTTREVLAAITTASKSSAVSITDQYVLIGPKFAVNRYRTMQAIHQKNINSLRRQLDAEAFHRLIEPSESSWDNLAEPRQLLLDRATTIGITIQNPELVPHDLWAAAMLPPLPFSDFATLILNQFDLTFELRADGRMKVLSVPDNVTLEQRHRVPLKEKEAIQKRWQTAFPNLTVTWKGSTAIVSTTVETHENLLDLIDAKSEPQVAAASIRDRKFTMNAPIGTSMGQIIMTFRKSGVPIRTEGKSDTELDSLLQQTTEFDLNGVAGKDFFPLVFRPWNVKVEVLDFEVVLTFRGN